MIVCNPIIHSEKQCKVQNDCSIDEAEEYFRKYSPNLSELSEEKRMKLFIAFVSRVLSGSSDNFDDKKAVRMLSTFLPETGPLTAGEFCKVILNLKNIRASYRDRNPRLYPCAVKRQCDEGSDFNPGMRGSFSGFILSRFIPMRARFD